MWGLWGFAPAAGLVFLTLIPAIRRGRDYLLDNGSPWPWPFYPWSVFVFLAVAVCGRAFLLCFSYHLLPNIEDAAHLRPLLPCPVRPGAGGVATRDCDRRGQSHHAVDRAGRSDSRSFLSPRSGIVPKRSTPSFSATSTRRSAGCRSSLRSLRPAGSISMPRSAACPARWREPPWSSPRWRL